MKDNTVVYINWDGFGKYYLDHAIKNKYKIETLKSVIQEGVYYENAYTLIPSITNAMQPTIVSGTTPKYTDNHFRYFNKDTRKVVQEEPRRINRAETIAEALSRQNLKIISINQFALENKGTFRHDKNCPYISIPGKNGMKRFDYASDFVKTLNASGHIFEKMPRFIALYMDELDDLGHNDKIVHGIPIAYTEEDRIETVMQGLEILDHKLGEFIDTVKELDLYNKFTFILTSDHGMTTYGRQVEGGDNFPSSLSELIADLELHSYKVEVLIKHEFQKNNDTDIVIVTVGLQVQLSYPQLFEMKEIKKRNNKIINHLKEKTYFGEYKEVDELESQGIKRGFTDLLISPKIPYNFKPVDSKKNLCSKGQHDSLDSTSQNVPLIMWGDKIKKNLSVQDKVFVNSVAPTIAVLLENNLPLDATANILFDQLLINKPEIEKTPHPFNGRIVMKKKIYRLDINYKSGSDEILSLYINNKFVRYIFFPKTYNEGEKKIINITLQQKEVLELKPNIIDRLDFQYIDSLLYSVSS